MAKQRSNSSPKEVRGEPHGLRAGCQGTNPDSRRPSLGFRDLAVRTISVKQGLSSDSVASVLAARDGSVWLGAIDALNRWNNGQITIYRKGSSGLPDDAVESLHQDDRGRVWVSTHGGFGYLDDGRFTPVSDVPGGAVHAIAGDSAGDLWISYQQHGLFHLVEERVVEQIPWAKLGRKEHADALLPDPLQGGLWLGFDRGGVPGSASVGSWACGLEPEQARRSS